MTLRVAHVLNSAGRGGVPRVAHALIRHADRSLVLPHLFHLKPGKPDDAPPPVECDVAAATGLGGKTGAMADLLDWLIRRRIDILHCHSFRPNLYARLACAALRPEVRIVSHYHNIYADKWCDPQVLSLERTLGRVTDARIAVSEAVADHVAGQLGLRRQDVDVVGNGIDFERLSYADRDRGRAALGIPPGVPLVGLVGRLCKQKGPDTFVEAALSILADTPELRFVLVGDIEDAALAAKLHERIRIAGFSERILLTGHSDRIGDILAALDVLAAPSRWEGFGLVLAEAMWLGVPIVASAVDAIPSVTCGTARLVPAEAPAALADAIRSALVDPAPSRGRTDARQMTWETAAGKVQQIYDRVTRCPSSISSATAKPRRTVNATQADRMFR
jgi:glycosyltransferase involved in cell wall biosynthesis